MTFKKLPIIGSLLLLSFTSFADEGMYPLSDLKKVNFKKAGFRISQTDLYNPNGTSLIDALVNVGGCTGSFISDKGLIITNHHCAFDAVAKASTPEMDYLTKGFVARTLEMEIEAKGLTCRITESYEDVSTQVLDAVKTIKDPTERIKIINQKRTDIAKAAEEKDKTIKAEVSEMFIGRSYVLFRYKTIQDVRLVYVPQRSIGEFGGEADNWVWPRHTGDFSFMRAYVAADGSTAAFSNKNVPYKPKKFLKINPHGLKEEDMVFILGYPGRTFRHRPAAYLQYQQQYILPYVSSLYEWQNNQMLQIGANDKAADLKLASRIKRNANVLKNYTGKLQGMRSIHLVEQKQAEEKQLQAFIEQSPMLKDQYSNLIGEINTLYQEIYSDANRDLWFTQLFPSSNLLSAANSLYSLQNKLKETAVDKRADYLKENTPKLRTSLEAMYNAYIPEADKRLLSRMISDGLKMPDNQRIATIDNNYKGMDESTVRSSVDKLYSETQLSNSKLVLNLLSADADKIMSFKDPILDWVTKINEQLTIINQMRQKREGTLNKLMGDYVEVKSQWKKADFIPDANSTLRLTYGHIRGYSPADGVYQAPFTYLKGVLQKGAMGGEYEMPEVLNELYEKKDFGPFAQAGKNDVPVAFLYNLDTTGGNSGSPIMNASGELIGVNFDRAYTATINDFAWNERYSRSIGVDIRYVLWVASKVDKADFLLKELGVSTVKHSAHKK